MTEEDLHSLIDGSVYFVDPFTHERSTFALSKGERKAFKRAQNTGYLVADRQISRSLDRVHFEWCCLKNIPQARIEGGGKSRRRIEIDCITLSNKIVDQPYTHIVLCELFRGYWQNHSSPPSEMYAGFYTSARIPAEYAESAMRAALNVIRAEAIEPDEGLSLRWRPEVNWWHVDPSALKPPGWTRTTRAESKAYFRIQESLLGAVAF